VVRERRGAHWSVELVPAWRMSHHLAKIDGRLPDEVVISAVDRLGNEGRAARLPIAGTAMMRDP
jgi:hypothetical protein